MIKKLYILVAENWASSVYEYFPNKKHFCSFSFSMYSSFIERHQDVLKMIVHNFFFKYLKLVETEIL